MSSVQLTGVASTMGITSRMTSQYEYEYESDVKA
jgi:hypothetical protein